MTPDALKAWYEENRTNPVVHQAVKLKDGMGAIAIARIRARYVAEGNDPAVFELSVIHELVTRIERVHEGLLASLEADLDAEFHKQEVARLGAELEAERGRHLESLAQHGAAQIDHQAELSWLRVQHSSQVEGLLAKHQAERVEPCNHGPEIAKLADEVSSLREQLVAALEKSEQAQPSAPALPPTDPPTAPA